METGRNHIRQHTCVSWADVGWQQCQVAVCIIYMEVFGKYAIFEVGEFPAR